MGEVRRPRERGEDDEIGTGWEGCGSMERE